MAGVWSQMRSSFNATGHFIPGMPFNPNGEGKAYKNLMGMSAAPEGFLHSIKRGILDQMGLDNMGRGNILAASGTQHLRYGGAFFTRSGWREITHDVKAIGSSGFYKLGARRSLAGMVGRGIMKGIGPAFFLYQAATEGLGEAVKTSVIYGAAWGAGRWALGKIGLGLASPLTIGAGLIAGAALGGRQALIAGRKYNQDIRAVSFGNAMPDTYGTIGTMRQAAVNAIQSSKLNGRSILGAEASLLHQS